MKIKIWLDDQADFEGMPNRKTPEGFIPLRSAYDVIRLLEQGNVEVVDLDHDLGHEDESDNGYTVVKWIEERVATDPSYIPPEIRVHTENSEARDRMLLGIKSIKRFLANRTEVG